MRFLAAAILLLPFSASCAEKLDVLVYSAPKVMFFAPNGAPNSGPVGQAFSPSNPPSFDPDPGLLFSKELSKKLNFQKYSGLLLPDSTIPGPERIGKIVNLSGKDRLIVFTYFHFLGYRPFAWKTYQYGYGAHVRIVNESGQTTYQAKCMVSSSKSDPNLQLDVSELTNQAKLMNIVELAANQCADQLLQELSSKV